MLFTVKNVYLYYFCISTTLTKLLSFLKLHTNFFSYSFSLQDNLAVSVHNLFTKNITHLICSAKTIVVLSSFQLQKKLHCLEEQLNNEMQAKDELEQKYRSNFSRLEKITKELDEEVTLCFTFRNIHNYITTSALHSFILVISINNSYQKYCKPFMVAKQCNSLVN